MANILKKVSDFTKSGDVQNIYKLDGYVPIGRAIPYGLQHVLAMFVSNLVPVLIVCNLAVSLTNPSGKLDPLVEIPQILQSAMFIAGLATLIQLYPIWRIGAKLPVVMGVSFTFLGSLIAIAMNPSWGYESMLGAIIVGGCFEGLLGLSAKYWRRFISPIVSACVVTTIGFSLLGVGMNSFGGGQGSPTFGAWYHIVVGTVTLLSCLLFQHFAKGVWKNLNVLFGLFVGYIVSLIITFSSKGSIVLINFDKMKETVNQLGLVELPFFPILEGHTPTFHLGAIFTIILVFIVSAAETIGDTTAVCTGGLGRDITEKEVSGSLACDGFSSALSGVFGCCPVTSFSQNVGLVAMTKVVNRFTILMGALVLIICSFFPPIGAFFNSLPDAVLGGCTIMMFGSIVYSGIKMISACDLNNGRNMIIVALSFCIGIGVTSTDPKFFSAFPKIIGDIFHNNPVAGVFLISFILDKVLPKKMN